MANLAHRLGRLVAPALAEPDGDLLARFVTDRDGEAFAALVRRHGPMVFAVCRRVLRHRQDAEDAFQATFLVLARRAGAVRPRAAVGNWLHGVAYRTALAARRVAAARQVREARAGAMRGTETAPVVEPPPDLREALDRELAALPDTCRAAIVACDLEGLSRREAAARLGWTEGTLSSRLARGRAVLARRLGKYGLAVPAAGLGMVAGPAAGALPPGLADATVRMGILVAAGEAVATAPVAALTEETMKALLLTKLKGMTAALVVGCAVLATAGAGWRANAVGAADPPGDSPRRAEDPPRDTPRRAEAPRPVRDADKGRPVRDADKERIAELERERDRLLKEVAELRDRLAAAEAMHRARAEAEARADRGRPRAEDPLILRSETRPGREPARPERGAEWAPTPPAAPVADAPPVVTTRVRPVAPPVPPRPVPPRAPDMAPLGTTPAKPEATPAARSVVRVYPVGVLAGDDKGGEALVKVVKATSSCPWGVDTGVEYLPSRNALVVRQTPQGHEEVTQLLRLLQAEEEGQAPPRERKPEAVPPATRR